MGRPKGGGDLFLRGSVFPIHSLNIAAVHLVVHLDAGVISSSIRSQVDSSTMTRGRPNQIRRLLKASFSKVNKVAKDSYLVEDFMSLDQAGEALKAIDGEVQYLGRDHPSLQFRIYGKTVQLPRDKAVYGEVTVDEEKKERVEPFYKYAKDTPLVASWAGMHAKILAEQIKEISGQACNHLVVNQYPDGNSYIGEHRDKDGSFEPGSSVLTVSLGSERVLRLKKFKGRRIGKSKNIVLPVGSLFVLGPRTNAKWKHSIPKSRKVLGRRVSLTYRAIAGRRTTPTQSDPVVVEASSIIQ